MRQLETGKIKLLHLCLLPIIWLAFLFNWQIPLMAQETCMLMPAPLAERVEKATIILEGKVTSQHSWWDQQHRNIYTTNLVEVYKIFKGIPTGTSVIEVITEGGSVGDALHVFSATLRLHVGQQGLFFLEASQLPVKNQASGFGNSYQVYSSMQGFIRYNLPYEEAQEPFGFYASINKELYPALIAFPEVKLRTIRPNPELARAYTRPLLNSNTNARTQATPVITSFSPESITAGTGAILTISGQNFGTSQGNGFVEFTNANDGGVTFIKPQAADYISWTNNEIKVKVPSNSGTGTAGSGQVKVTNSDPNVIISSQVLLVTYAVSTVIKDSISYPAYHINSNSTGGYTMQFASNLGEPARQSFLRAMQTWTCQTAINWQASASFTPLSVTAEDGINLVRFAAAGELPANVLGRTISRYNGCLIQNRYNYWVQEFDFEFNRNIRWQFGPEVPLPQQFDFETTCLHELGHGHQLSHINNPEAVMHYAINRNQVKRNLNGYSDIDGGNFITSRSFRNNACATPMSPLVTDNCLLTDSLLSFAATQQSNGQTLLTWSTTGPNQNLTYFVPERSSNGIKWIGLANILPHSSSSYQTIDKQPFPGFTYYRLRLVFADSTYNYSPIRRVGSEDNVTATALLYPNPIQNEQLYLEYQAPTAGTLNLRIYDTAGRLHATLIRNVTKGSNPFYFKATALHKGLYLLRATLNAETRTFKFIKL